MCIKVEQKLLALRGGLSWKEKVLMMGRSTVSSWSFGPGGRGGMEDLIRLLS